MGVKGGLQSLQPVSTRHVGIIPHYGSAVQRILYNVVSMSKLASHQSRPALGFVHALEGVRLWTYLALSYPHVLESP